MIRTLLFSLATLASVTASVSTHAGDQGTLNQSSVYERSMTFYLHPAGYFFESSRAQEIPTRNADHPAIALRRASQAADVQGWTHPALRKGVSRSLVAAHAE